MRDVSGFETRPVFVVFEGRNGAGKSTLAKMFSSVNGAELLSSPPEITGYNLKRSNFDVEGVDLRDRFAYYMGGNRLISDYVKNNPLNSRIIVCDRYIDSTIAYHTVMGVDQETIAEAVSLEFMIPDIIFFITISDELERTERMISRGVISRTDMQEKDDEFLLAYLSYFSDDKKFIQVDTYAKTPEESLSEICDVFKSFQFRREV